MHLNEASSNIPEPRISGTAESKQNREELVPPNWLNDHNLVMHIQAADLGWLIFPKELADGHWELENGWEKLMIQPNRLEGIKAANRC